MDSYNVGFFWESRSLNWRVHHRFMLIVPKNSIAEVSYLIKERIRGNNFKLVGELIDKNRAFILALKSWVANLLIVSNKGEKMGILGISEMESRLKSWFYFLIMLPALIFFPLLVGFLTSYRGAVFFSLIIMGLLIILVASYIPYKKCVSIGREVAKSLKSLF